MCTDRVTVQRAPNPAAAASGAAERVYATHLTNVPFSIQARSGSYRQREDGMAPEAMFVGFCPGVPDIKAGDRILHGTTRYDVTFVANQFGHHLECDLALVVVP